jgi:hypothetical protein
MATPSCPFHGECQFHNNPKKTPSDELMTQLFCLSRYETCQIMMRFLQGKPVPVGACPDGNVRL